MKRILKCFFSEKIPHFWYLFGVYNINNWLHSLNSSSPEREKNIYYYIVMYCILKHSPPHLLCSDPDQTLQGTHRAPHFHCKVPTSVEPHEGFPQHLKKNGKPLPSVRAFNNLVEENQVYNRDLKQRRRQRKRDTKITFALSQ